MRKIFVLAAIFMSAAGFAQDAVVSDMKATAERKLEDDTSHKQGWKRGVNVNLGMAQGSTSNWAAGGDRYSFSVNTYVNLYANLKKGDDKWVNNLDLFYAIMNTSSQGKKKNDDRIDLYSKYTHQVTKKLGFGAVGNFRTQFTSGYDYGAQPEERISDFMAPAYLTLAPGMEWSPTKFLSIFFSPISAKWTFVKKDLDTLGIRYGLDPGKTSKFEAGAFVSVNFKRELFKNVELKSRLDLYSNYLEKPQNVDVFWTNVLTMKVNKWLGVTYNFDLIYDDNARLFGPDHNAPRTQLKSLLSVGFAGRF